MSLFFWRKKDPSQEIYPSFNTRIFCSIIDTTLATIALIPILYWVLPFLYGGTLPSQKLHALMQGLEPSMQAQKVKEFMSDHWLSLVIEKAWQIVILAVFVFGFWVKTNSTPGKLLFSIKILDEKTLQPPSAFQYIVRMLAYFVSVLPLCIGIFYIAFNKKRRAWHDIIAGTVVVYYKKFRDLSKSPSK